VPHTTETAGAVLVAGFRTVAWLGPAGAAVPDLGVLAHRAEPEVDRAGRVTIDRLACAYLAVADSRSFSVVLVPAPAGGLFVVPVEDFGRRFGEVADARRAG
jgi:hypothetical protein